MRGQAVSSPWMQLATAFVQQFSGQLQQLGDASRTFRWKQGLIDKMRETYYANDSTLLFDDIYLYDVPEQYFGPEQYLYTWISWYPNGLEVKHKTVAIQNLEIRPESHAYTLKIHVQRMLKGTDYLENHQLDTADLTLVLRGQLSYQSSEILIQAPKIFLVIPFRSDRLPEEPQATSILAEGNDFEVPHHPRPARPPEKIRSSRILESMSALPLPTRKRKRRQKKWMRGL